MTATARAFDSFDQAFAMAFEEEISGESFFDALARAEPDPRRSALWAKIAVVENRTSAALRSVAAAFSVLPPDEAAVLQSGRDEAAAWQALPWREVMATMVRDYPAYVAEFEDLKARAPAAAKAAAQLLIDHEIAIIDMARAELAGDADPAAPLDAYLAHLAAWSGKAPYAR